MFKIGTLADWFGVGVIDGIKQSQACGAQGVQLYAWNELDPTKTSPQKLEEVKRASREYSQEIVALCGELGGHGFEIKEENEKKINYLKTVVDMAVTLECSVVTTHIGVIPADIGCDKYKVMQEACALAGGYAQSKGVTIAVETGPELITTLKHLVDSCAGGVGINYDPANLIMVTNDDEVAGVITAGSSIVHTHAKDGVMYEYLGPEKVYELFAQGGIEALNKIDKSFKEMPLGQGSVHWKEYLKALKEIGYRGYLTIEREVGENATTDIKLAADFLKDLIREI